MWARSLGREDPLEEEMATDSSTLAWEFHGQRNPVGYSPWGQKGKTERPCMCMHVHTHTHYLNNSNFLLFIASTLE